ncbi:Transcription elongation factor 1 [Orchesella cincta]|uniref:Transcription elongation factor 1 homolog n=1 Tax=Orchesella cincta TaxID=48709 RepID=A0A1D2N838_ORCCI|nr:Transcription elongation factor 1 [Orchesella cincta]
MKELENRLNRDITEREEVISTMGKRKSRKKPPAKARSIQPLDTQFNCPFCNHESSCEVKMDRTRKTAKISCHICMECFQTQIHNLSEPVDVYNDWIDACEEAN